MLRPVCEWDLDWIKNERNRPELRRTFRQPRLLTDLGQKKWYETTDMESFVVCNEHKNIGVVSLSHIDYIARKCEFSIMIIPEERHQGYGKRALYDLLDHAFNDLNMHQVFSDVFETNPEALTKYVDWGFKIYGVLPQWYWKDGKYINSTIIAITKDEYNSLKQTVSE